MARPRRIVCYAINGSGLGHVTRLLGISRWMRRLATFVEGSPPDVFFLSSSEAPQLTLEAGFPTFKLPSKTIARQAGMDMLEYRRLAKHFIWNTLGVFRPDLLVVDTFPSGSFDELFQVLDGPFRKGLILREVKREYAARPMFRAALRLYDEILVPGESAAVDRMALPPGLPVTPVGRLTQLDAAEFYTRDQARTHLGLAKDARVVYLSAGGGGDATSAEMLQATSDALAALDCTVVIGAGPLYRGPKVASSDDRAGSIVWCTQPGLSRCFKAFDVAISAAGYNTYHELMLARVPTIFMPQVKVADDQARRVDEAVAMGAALRMGPGCTAEDIVRTVAGVLDGAAAPSVEAMARVFETNNALTCAARLLSGLYDVQALARAVDILSPDFVHALPRDLDSAEEAALWGKLLPALTPPGTSNTGIGGAVESLLPWLSEAARSEVTSALQAQAADGWIGALHAGVPRLVAAAGTAGISLRDAANLVEVAIRKHPLSNNGSETAAWLGEITDLLVSVIQAGEDRMTLYRYWPKVVDVGCADAHALFAEFVEAGSRSQSGAVAWELQRTLTGLKASVKRVTRVDVQTWIQSLQGATL